LPLLFQIFVPIIHSSHAANDVAEATLSVVVGNASPREQSASGSAEVVEPEASDATGVGQVFLALVKTSYRSCPGAGEYVIANVRKGRQHILRSPREWSD
jgi:hypothetical protein